MEAKDVAIDLIKVYVDRGDDYHSLKSGQMGCWSSDYHAQIKGDKIEVLQIGEVKCSYLFGLQKVMDEIRSGQQRLL